MVGALVCAVAFIIATGLLADQVSRFGRQLDALRKEQNIQQKNDESRDKLSDPVCTTRECVTSGIYLILLKYEILSKIVVYILAGALLEAMDTTADPCQDFFQFACGGWIKKNGIPN